MIFNKVGWFLFSPKAYVTIILAPQDQALCYKENILLIQPANASQLVILITGYELKLLVQAYFSCIKPSGGVSLKYLYLLLVITVLLLFLEMVNVLFAKQLNHTFY